MVECEKNSQSEIDYDIDDIDDIDDDDIDDRSEIIMIMTVWKEEEDTTF